jgi:hypothetical protein
MSGPFTAAGGRQCPAQCLDSAAREVVLPVAALRVDGQRHLVAFMTILDLSME